jgi:hypothetical protein
MTIIGVMGVIGMVLVSMVFLSFLGKVGGAAGIQGLKEELLIRHAAVIADEKGLQVRVVILGEGDETSTSLRIAFTPVEIIAKAPARLELYMRRMARHIYAKPEWARLYDHIDVVAVRESDEIHRRYTQIDCEALDVR